MKRIDHVWNPLPSDQVNELYMRSVIEKTTDSKIDMLSHCPRKIETYISYT